MLSPLSVTESTDIIDVEITGAQPAQCDRINRHNRCRDHRCSARSSRCAIVYSTHPFKMSSRIRKSTISITSKLISAFVYAIRIIQFIFLNLNVPASSHLLCLYRTWSETQIVGFLARRLKVKIYYSLSLESLIKFLNTHE